MTADFSSSNPFRRKGPLSSSTISPPSNPTVNHFMNPEQSANSNLEYLYIEPKDVPKKIPKKVRVQSPPPPSPSIPDSISTLGEDSTPFENPTRITREDEQDPFDSITSDISEHEEEHTSPRARILNPFSKTLETMENPARDALGISHTNITSPGRASMDVDAFKRLLMTGNAGLGPSTPMQLPPVHALRDEGSSSTDTSSLSRQSIFEPIQEPHLESPRSSHEISEPEEVRRVMSDSSSLHVKKKPPPPSSRHHGKLIKMELKDEPTAVSPLSPPQPISTTPQYVPIMTSTPNRSLTDLNKPLPPAPPRGSGESDRESPFDRESAGKTPEPPSPSSSIRRKAAPPPPVTRRHSQLVNDSKLSRSVSGRLSPRLEEDNVSVYSIESGRPQANSGKVPPPPPTRKHGLSRTQSQHISSSLSTTSLPIPPPRRGSSKHGRAPSVHSIEDPSPYISKRTSMQGPPPPPRPRQSRNSLDVSPVLPLSSPHASSEYRRSSNSSSMSQNSRFEEQTTLDSTGGNTNILADISALQREIDALRNQSQRRSVT
ncbi:hypothetical protein SBOR_1785 [Sclerotinia borealis F-4128]|uniref:Uncharacterized protein n=1 Tax=Sclerotinia borealis (strain F-4128) TaxID=1432307 RepID=W9CTN9_SCLBF|nr:hypothetical protein SBOR_1785 [Sclerotinia borealis F-4128]